MLCYLCHENEQAPEDVLCAPCADRVNATVEGALLDEATEAERGLDAAQRAAAERACLQFRRASWRVALQMREAERRELALTLAGIEHEEERREAAREARRRALWRTAAWAVGGAAVAWMALGRVLPLPAVEWLGK